MKVLIVEDDKNLLVVLYLYIEKMWNYGCEVAHDGVEAIEILKEHNIDVIISDFNMPFMTGLDLRLKIESEFSQCPPFILFSAKPSPVEQHYKKLFNSILEKDGNFEALHIELKKIEGLRNSQPTTIRGVQNTCSPKKNTENHI